MLDYAHKLRLAGIGKESALRQTLAYAGKLRKKTKN
jgi:tRNA nucleotidyltransferase (CCA-adding enzyme)